MSHDRGAFVRPNQLGHEAKAKKKFFLKESQKKGRERKRERERETERERTQEVKREVNCFCFSCKKMLHFFIESDF